MTDPLEGLFSSFDNTPGKPLTAADLDAAKDAMLNSGPLPRPPIMAGGLPDSMVRTLLRCGMPMILNPSQWHLVDEYNADLEEERQQGLMAQWFLRNGAMN